MPGPTPDSEPDWLRCTPLSSRSRCLLHCRMTDPAPPSSGRWAAVKSPSARHEARIAGLRMRRIVWFMAADPSSCLAQVLDREPESGRL